MWFLKLIVSFFFSIDKIIYGFISTIYDLLITISRTTILSQSQINEFYQKVYMLLGIFMLFKVGFSLITYVVNPDDFSDKNKGIGKIGQNVIISLCMLVLVPYAFNMAYDLQRIILEDNILANVILGKSDGDTDINYINTAGDTMAFTVLNAFVTPNTSLEKLNECVNIWSGDNLNPDCFGYNLKDDGTFEESGIENNTMRGYQEDIKDTNGTIIKNYMAGLKNENVGLMFRLNLLKATVEENSEEKFLIEYRYIFSTVTGVVVVLMLLGFCLDVALRSVKLAFLQMIAPIPIISYIDPKSGKDGLFKKWYKMCFSTFLSLFVRLLALYFGIYIISKVTTMTDIITGSTVTNGFVQIFIIIGVLMFVKQLPKILEGLGIKIDGDGKFNLNPLKKIEEGTFGGKRLTGAAAGFAIGALGNKGNPFKAVGGAFRGFSGNQGLSGAAKHQANVNKQLRQARLDGSTIGGRMNARWVNATGAKGFNNVEKQRKKMENLNEVAKSISAAEDVAVQKIQNGEAGAISRQYKEMVANAESLKSAGRTAEAVKWEMAASEYLNNQGKYEFMDISSGKRTTYSVVGIDAATGKLATDHTERAENEKNGTLAAKIEDYRSMAANKGQEIKESASDMHDQLSGIKKETGEIERKTYQQSKNNEADQKYVEAAKIKK